MCVRTIHWFQWPVLLVILFCSSPSCSFFHSYTHTQTHTHSLRPLRSRWPSRIIPNVLQHWRLNLYVCVHESERQRECTLEGKVITALLPFPTLCDDLDYLTNIPAHDVIKPIPKNIILNIKSIQTYSICLFRIYYVMSLFRLKSPHLIKYLWITNHKLSALLI